MTDEPDIFEKAFGKAPETGYDITSVRVEAFDNENFKGIEINWAARGVGFGQLIFSWGVSDWVKDNWPRQYGFHADTEQMSEEMVTAILIAAAPKLAKLLIEADR